LPVCRERKTGLMVARLVRIRHDHVALTREILPRRRARGTLAMDAYTRRPRRRSCPAERRHRNRRGAPRAAAATMTPRCSARSAPPTPAGRRVGAPSPTRSTPGQRLRRPVPQPAGGHRRPRSPRLGRNPWLPDRTPRTPPARAPYPANAPASRSIYRQVQSPDPHRRDRIDGPAAILTVIRVRAVTDVDVRNPGFMPNGPWFPATGHVSRAGIPAPPSSGYRELYAALNLLSRV
jgi:hypothetical protein